MPDDKSKPFVKINSESVVHVESLSLNNFGKVSEVAKLLIEKISSAISIWDKPRQIKVEAEANAEANLIKARNIYEIEDLYPGTMCRILNEQANQHKNIDNIVKKALPSLRDESDPNQMENDWIANFFQKSRIVSDGEMQNLWANVLAGEANSPGSFSKRTVNFLGDIDKGDAELFQTLCRFGWNIGYFTPLIFAHQSSFYTNKGIDFDTLSHLDSIGLIKFGGMRGFVENKLPKDLSASYCNQQLILKVEIDMNDELDIGQVLLTQVGRELASICKVEEVDGFFDYVKEHWSMHLHENQSV